MKTTIMVIVFIAGAWFLGYAVRRKSVDSPSRSIERRLDALTSYRPCRELMHIDGLYRLDGKHYQCFDHQWREVVFRDWILETDQLPEHGAVGDLVILNHDDSVWWFYAYIGAWRGIIRKQDTKDGFVPTLIQSSVRSGTGSTMSGGVGGAFTATGGTGGTATSR